ncbi:GroES-like protein [Brevibacterium mcbrellneri ATCC 49030]|uniref:GroES-like protein n=1 Tax=Brevibacterium mcbrellneri ATCC 49030 TaxID=585530 RepID=D4YLN7_9MICO|nr:alcohol dehydrogenase catalytic domain-containing protein [Brevibacterium mcbrellneri]EFG47770.1 GroES-like protein [Brevibacterium mcbrellneri ATCC 49030]
MKITGAVLREMRAQRPYAQSRPIDITSVELDEPGPHEVLIRMTAAGLCHSDLSVVDGNRPRPLPMLLGHEGAGVVEKVGEGVTEFTPGDHVVTVFLPRCGQCANCATDGKLPCTPGTASNNAGVLPFDGEIRRLSESGDSTHPRAGQPGEPINHHLGVSVFATHAVVNAASVVKVGSDVPPQIAAPLGCAVLTGGGAVLNAGKPAPGDDIMVVGLGGVGMAALLTALSVGTEEVIGVDANPEKLERARKLGASQVYTPAEVAEAGVKAPVVIEAAGHPKAFETAYSATAVGGTTVTVGLPAPDAISQIHPLTLTAEARTVVGSYLGSAVPSRDIPQYEQMWREGKLPVEELVSGIVRLDDINAAMDTLADGKAVRQVVLFD